MVFYDDVIEIEKDVFVDFVWVYFFMQEIKCVFGEQIVNFGYDCLVYGGMQIVVDLFGGVFGGF